MKKCVACAEEILLEAKLCKYCETLQSDTRFLQPKVAQSGKASEDIVNASPPRPPAPEKLIAKTSSSALASEQANHPGLAVEAKNYFEPGQETPVTNPARRIRPSIIGAFAIGLLLVGALAAAVIPTITAPSQEVATGSAEQNDSTMQEASPEASLSDEPTEPAEASKSESEEEAPSSNGTDVQPEPSPSQAPGEPEESIQDQLQNALDAWIVKVTAPETATFVEEEDIFQGCPEDMCGPLTNVTFSFPSFPSDFGNTVCEAFLSVQDRSSGSLLNDGTWIGEVHVGVESLTPTIYLQAVSSGPLTSTNNLRVECRTIHGLTKATKMFNLEIVTSN